MDRFKVGILILGVGFLLVYYLNSKNHRYIFDHSAGLAIQDSRTGVIYRFMGDISGKWNFEIFDPSSKSVIKQTLP